MPKRINQTEFYYEEPQKKKERMMAVGGVVAVLVFSVYVGSSIGTSQSTGALGSQTEGTVDVHEIGGCMDEDARNYDEDATVDDDTCKY